MKSLKITQVKRFYFQAPAFQSGLTDVALFIYKADGSLYLGPLAASEWFNLATPGIYRTTAVTFVLAGVYRLKWESATLGPEKTVWEELHVIYEDTGDFVAGGTYKFPYEAPNGETGLTDVRLHVYTNAGDLYGSSPYTLVEVEDGLYQSPSINMPDAGYYVFIYGSETLGPTGGAMAEYYASDATEAAAGLRTVEVYLIRESTPQQPIQDALILLSRQMDGIAVAQNYTDSMGKAVFKVPDGVYVATARMGNYVFSRNNILATVQDPDTAPNQFYLLTGYFLPAWLDDPVFAPASMTTMKIRLAGVNGMPLEGLEVLISGQTAPMRKQDVGGDWVGVAMGDTRVRTDAQGRAAVALLRESAVRVAIRQMGILRSFTVPDEDVFELFGIYDSTEDAMSVIIPQVTEALRMTP